MYSAYVCRITDVRKDPNSDRLYLGRCFGEGVIVGPDTSDGELVLYLPSDGKIEHWFGDRFTLFRKNEDGSPQGGYIEQSGHIKAIKLRGNQSSGVVIKLSHIYDAFGDQGWHEGDAVTEINKKVFCSKYMAHPFHDPQCGNKTSYKGRKTERVTYEHFDMHADTAQLAYCLNQLHEGDRISLSLKMHGTSSRHAYTEATLPRNWFRRLFHLKPKTRMEYVLGTRRTICEPNKDGFYGTDEFRWKIHEKVKPHLTPGLQVYGEIVGWYGPGANQTIMPSADNKKMNDKGFIKKYGPTTVFSYGCEPGECEFYVYRITDDNGRIEYTPAQIAEWCEKTGLKHVPYIDEFDFTTQEDLMERINKYFEDDRDPVGKTHVKEGVVVRILNRPRWTAYKIKTFPFKILSNIATEAVANGDTQIADSDILEEM